MSQAFEKIDEVILTSSMLTQNFKVVSTLRQRELLLPEQ